MSLIIIEKSVGREGVNPHSITAATLAIRDANMTTDLENPNFQTNRQFSGLGAPLGCWILKLSGVKLQILMKFPRHIRTDVQEDDGWTTPKTYSD